MSDWFDVIDSRTEGASQRRIRDMLYEERKRIDALPPFRTSCMICGVPINVPAKYDPHEYLEDEALKCLAEQAPHFPTALKAKGNQAVIARIREKLNSKGRI